MHPLQILYETLSVYGMWLVVFCFQHWHFQSIRIPVEEWECWTILVRAPGLGNYSMSSSGSCIRPWLIPGTPSSRQKIDFLRSRDPDTTLPVLLITAWRSTQFLEESLPYHTQFCHNMSLALAYLYSKSIIHCDLSSNSELLIANRITKNSPMPSHDSTHNGSRYCSTHEPWDTQRATTAHRETRLLLTWCPGHCSSTSSSVNCPGYTHT